MGSDRGSGSWALRVQRPSTFISQVCTLWVFGHGRCPCARLVSGSCGGVAGVEQNCVSRVVLGGHLVGRAPGDPCPPACSLMLAAVTPRSLGPAPACSPWSLLRAFSFVAASFTHLVHLPVWEARFGEEGTDDVLGCPCLSHRFWGQVPPSLTGRELKWLECGSLGEPSAAVRA